MSHEIRTEEENVRRTDDIGTRGSMATRPRGIVSPYKIFWIGVGGCGCNLLTYGLNWLRKYENKLLSAKLFSIALGNRYLAINSGPELGDLLRESDLLQGKDVFTSEDVVPLRDEPDWLTGADGKVGRGAELFNNNIEHVKAAIRNKAAEGEVILYLVTNSANGGTGAGSTSLLLKELRKMEPWVYIYNFQVLPFHWDDKAVFNVLYDLSEVMKLMYEGEAFKEIEDEGKKRKFKCPKCGEKNDVMVNECSGCKLNLKMAKTDERLKVLLMSNQHFYEDVSSRESRIDDRGYIVYEILNPIICTTISTLFYPILVNEYGRELENIKRNMTGATFDPKKPFLSNKCMDMEDISGALLPFTVPSFIDKINPEISFEESLRDLLSNNLTKTEAIEEHYIGLTATLRQPYAKGCLAIISGNDPDKVGFRSLQKMQEAMIKTIDTIPALVKVNFYQTPDEDVKLTLFFGGANIDDFWYWLEQFDYQYEIVRDEIYSHTRISTKEFDEVRRRFYRYRKIIFPKKVWELEMLRPPEYIPRL